MCTKNMHIYAHTTHDLGPLFPDENLSMRKGLVENGAVNRARTLNYDWLNFF